MVKLKDFIQFKVSKDDLRSVWNDTLRNVSISKLDNLRYRSKAVQLDCLFRGYLGEFCLKRWFAEKGISIYASHVMDDFDMDIDMLYNGRFSQYAIEVKTSNIPDAYGDFTGVIQKADIKLIKRTDRIEDLKGDIHIQIYFDFLRKIRDSFLNRIEVVDIDDRLYDKLQLESYIDNIYFVAWIDKPSLIRYINSMPFTNRTWSFPGSYKSFWKCSLNTIAKEPILLIDYLKSL